MKKNKATKRRGWRIVLILLLSLLILTGGTLLGVYAWISSDIDPAADDRLFLLSKGSKTTKFYYNGAPSSHPCSYDGENSSAYQAVEIPNSRLHSEGNGIWTEYEKIPPHLRNAFVAIEDHRYFQHDGVDWLRTVKAVSNYLFHYDRRFGGSTITQQLVKNLSHDDEISVKRKLREILRAVHLDASYSKEEILELYMNIVPMSQNCVGVGSAAEVYFSKSVEELTLLEAVALVAITNSPAKYDPILQPDSNQARRNLILDAMKTYGWISAEEYESNYDAPLELHVKEEARQEQVYNWYVETVIDDVIRDLMEKKGMSTASATKLLYSGGLHVYTFMDARVQGILEDYFSDPYHFPWATRNRDLHFSMVVAAPTGELLGSVGNVGSKEGNRLLDYACDSLMPPGSAIKPLSVYGPALEEGLITWSTVLDDVPVTFGSAAKPSPWPHNFPSVYSGLTDISTAVAQSKNTIAVRVYRMLGAERSYSYLVNRLKLRSIVRSAYEGDRKYTDLAEAPLALGQLSYGATLREITNAYTSFYDGTGHRSRSYSAVYDSFGNLLLSNEAEETYVWSPQTAYIMTELLSNVVQYGTAKDIRLKYSVDTAGKTGTSGEDRDRWFVGYTPYYTAGIWCGYPDREYAIGDIAPTHLEIWDAVMKKIHRQIFAENGEAIRSFQMPSGIVQCTYCRDSGKLCSECCPFDPRNSRKSTGYFKAGTAPRTLCDRHVLVEYDESAGGISLPQFSFADGEVPSPLKRRVALIREESRSFPMQIYVSDAQYVYRDLRGLAPSEDASLPFFASVIPKGRYVGISHGTDGRQFNAYAQKQYEDEIEEMEEDRTEDMQKESGEDMRFSLEDKSEENSFYEDLE